MKLITPHGGRLINREVTGAERERLINASTDMPAVAQVLIEAQRALETEEMVGA